MKKDVSCTDWNQILGVQGVCTPSRGPKRKKEKCKTFSMIFNRALIENESLIIDPLLLNLS